MLNITIDGPKLDDLEAKRILIKVITDAIEKVYNLPREHTLIVIKENSPENAGVGGILISDRRRS